mmetsp:Transcript_6049/g.18765  ORF Transcript_6049/g.18765 Transcript_6049/m.18765 type:complete len:170 (+) Transcript_6049:116-625(+)
MTTVHWRSNESSLARNSFNALVARRHFDMPEDMWKNAMMSRQAVLGPEYVPNGIIARARAGTLRPTRAASLPMLPRASCSASLPGDLSRTFLPPEQRQRLLDDPRTSLQDAPPSPGGQRAASAGGSRCSSTRSAGCLAPPLLGPELPGVKSPPLSPASVRSYGSRFGLG